MNNNTMKTLPMVNCVKQYRSETGLGLKESLGAIKAMSSKDQWALAKRYDRERYNGRMRARQTVTGNDITSAISEVISEVGERNS